jgi:hypothetical protein
MTEHNPLRNRCRVGDGAFMGMCSFHSYDLRQQLRYVDSSSIATSSSQSSNSSSTHPWLKLRPARIGACNVDKGATVFFASQDTLNEHLC